MNAAHILADRTTNYKKALALYEESAQSCPRQARAAWTGIATIHAQTQNWPKAESATRKALNLARSDPELQVFLGGILLAQGRDTEATAHFDRARALAKATPLRDEIEKRIDAAQANGR